MELEQWIQLFGAISNTTTTREKSKWMVFSGGLVACAILVLCSIGMLVRGSDQSIGIGVAVLGLLLALAWAIIQQRLHVECDHWNRLLRSIESQFVGTEFHRSIHRLLLGEQVCVPNASWICGEWNAEAARFSAVTRHLSRKIMQWVPFLFTLSFVALILAVAIR
jgi:hypothetical protein